MLAARPLQQFVCKSCRSKLLAATASRRVDASNRTLWTTATHFSKRIRLECNRQHSSRHFSGSTRARDQASSTRQPPPDPERTPAELEDVARTARNTYGDVLPLDHLDTEEYVVYERMYGPPIKMAPEEELFPEELEEDTEPIGPITNTLFVEDYDGRLKEVQYYVDGNDETTFPPQEDPRKVNKKEVPLVAAVEVTDEAVEEEQEAEDVEEEEEDEVDELGGPVQRAHPLTVAGRFATSPTTVQLPKAQFVDPVSNILSVAAKKHLKEVSERVFGGNRFPHSTATPTPTGGGIEQKPIPLDPSQGKTGSMEANSYLAAVMPGTYASVMSILVETRKRLGSEWLESLLKKENGPLILDAGSGGAGVVAFREILRAEWERMQEESGTRSKGKQAPKGRASVLTGSDSLRVRVSQFLENTTFIPRLPEAIVEGQKIGRKDRKVFDIIIAPHSLWNLKDDYLRKIQVQRFWSLLNPDGGVLILMEKGLPRGFEVVAGARALLLDNFISSPGSEGYERRLQDQGNKGRFAKKDTGMIVAPCTNHSSCPMYKIPGVSRNRKDFCYFRQRYIRPNYLQRLLGGKSRNYEDVQFSYLAVQRGRDLREGENGIEQGQVAADRAFEGHGLDAEEQAEVEGEMEEVPQAGAEPTIASTQPVSTLSLPRLLLPAIKRKGHVILDVCTPAGRLERWTVPKSHGKQAYRDARKAQWGDLWALGAKTRAERVVRTGQGKAAGEEVEEGEAGKPKWKKSRVKKGRESRRDMRIRDNEERDLLREVD